MSIVYSFITIKIHKVKSFASLRAQDKALRCELANTETYKVSEVTRQGSTERDFSTKTNILNQNVRGIGYIYTKHTQSTAIFFSEIFYRL